MAKKVEHDGQHHTALMACLHLSRVKKWEYVKLLYNSKLNINFILASKQHQGTTECILPLRADEAIDMNMLVSGLSQLCPEHSDSVILALVEDDSAVVYYNIFHGIHQPDLPNRQVRQSEQ